MSVKLTIGSAVYNLKENHLREHIESIIAQLTDETELLLIDDCSANNSGAVCKEYAEANDRVRYINMGTNGGLSRVRNRTIKEARGTWIFFADGDDVLADHAIETALAFSDEKYDIIIHDRQIFFNTKTGQDAPPPAAGLIELPAGAGRDISISCLCMRPLDGDRHGLGKDAYYHAAWGAIYSRDFLLSRELLFPAGQKKAQDSVFNTYAYYCAEKIAYLPYVMYYYRKDMQGITQRYNPDFTETAISLIGHHRECMEKLYPDDTEVFEKYKSHRLISLSVDSMKLNIFHKNNPNPRDARKRAFLEFVNTPPFKEAINDYDTSGAWWGWGVPISLARKKAFSRLDFFFKHWNLCRLYFGAINAIKGH
ncbi:MAG: glycosyltransferase family 2 protein [Clostridia bacterium]|nr:glycosyltransferase family 2 protein [Clostridia bacterium]